MQNVLSQNNMLIDEIDRAYHQGSEKWTGCDWPTAFGALVMNLNGLKASQATLLARATSGKEQGCWHSAAAWLAGIEQEARDAEGQARQALAMAHAGDLRESLNHIQRACAIEAKYHNRLVWEPLRAAIEGAIRTSKRRD